MIFTVHNSSCGKVMFSLEYVKNSVHGGVCAAGGHAWQGGACVVGGMRAKGLCMVEGVHGRGCAWWGHAWQGDVCGGGGLSGRYTSYRNTFLFSTVIELSVICGIVVRYTFFFKVPNPMVQTRE